MPATSRPRLPLISILAAVAFFELILNRLFVRLLRLEPLAWNPRLLKLLDGVSLFVYELVSVLSVLLLLFALLRISVFGRHYRAGARLSFPLVGGVTVALGILGILFRLPPQLVFHLHLSFLFLALLVVLTIFSSPLSGNLKAGALFVLVGFALRIGPLMARRYSAVHLDPSTADALNSGFFFASAAASVCFMPRSRSRLASLVTWLAVCGVALFMRLDWEDASRVSNLGFDIDLPRSLWGQALVLVAVGFGLNTLVRLLSTPGLPRLRGWGLLLIALGGLQLTLPYQVALASLGLLCLAEAAVRPDGRMLTKESFEQLVREAAAAVGAPRLTMSGTAGAETVRLHSPPTDGLTLALTLSRRGGAIADVEVVVGEAPPRDPPFTLERRDAGRLGPRGEGELVEIGDPAFDAVFQLRDRRDVGARLLDDATRARLLEVSRGWLGVWPAAGVRYHARDLEPNDLPKLLPLLSDIAKRA